MRSKLLTCFSIGAIFIIAVIYLTRAHILSVAHGNTDFYKFYESVLFYFSGQNIYSHTFAVITTPSFSVWVKSDGNLSTPFFTLLLLPLHYLNYASAFQLWSAISIACILVGGVLALRPFPQWHKHTLPILALFALYIPNAESLAYGEIASMLLVIVASAWLLARHHHDASAGILIGIACAIKLFCGLFLIYFLCLKRNRLVLCSLGTFLAAFLLAGYVFGFNVYLLYYAVLHSIYWYGITWNVSFHGFFIRLFPHAYYFSEGLTVLCSLILISYLIRFWRKQDQAQFDIGFSLVIVSMLLLSPLGWVYYFPLLFIPYLVVVAHGNTQLHLTACTLLLASTLIGDFIRPEQLNTLSQLFVAGGIGFYVLLGVLGLLCVVGRGVQYSEKYAISETLWVLIYAVIFMPSLLSLGIVFRGLMECH